jgi:diamine N-acetyltransferase
LAPRITFVPVDRGNWLTMRALKLKPEQETFVSAPVVSLARCQIKIFGDRFEYHPMLIMDGAAAVGYVTPVCDPASARDYWIDDIMIDAAQQGRGYGRAAMESALRFILDRYPRCRGVQLTCFSGNHSARALYLSMGFQPTGGVDEEFGQPNYLVEGPALDKFRR